MPKLEEKQFQIRMVNEWFEISNEIDELKKELDFLVMRYMKGSLTKTFAFDYESSMDVAKDIAAIGQRLSLLEMKKETLQKIILEYC